MKNHKQQIINRYRSIFVLTAIFSLSLIFLLSQSFTKADANYFVLTNFTPFAQDWTNTGQITTDDDWSGVPSIIGYRGDDITGGTGVDPQTLLGEGTIVVDVNADEINPSTNTTGGVAEFILANPVVALQGSGTADAPYIDIRLNTLGCLAPANRINIGYTVRDIDGSADNAVQQVALQHRVGAAGNYTNIPAGYIADATTAGTATQTTPIFVALPAAAQGQAQVHVRIITSNAVGNDEWVGIDDINIACVPVLAAPASIGGQVKSFDGRGLPGVAVELSGGDLNEPLRAVTNPFGYYQFQAVPAGQIYTVSVSAKQYAFTQSSIVVNLNSDVADANFVADAP